MCINIDKMQYNLILKYITIQACKLYIHVDQRRVHLILTGVDESGPSRKLAQAKKTAGRSQAGESCCRLAANTRLLKTTSR